MTSMTQTNYKSANVRVGPIRNKYTNKNNQQMPIQASMSPQIRQQQLYGTPKVKQEELGKTNMPPKPVPNQKIAKQIGRTATQMITGGIKPNVKPKRQSLFIKSMPKTVSKQIKNVVNIQRPPKKVAGLTQFNTPVLTRPKTLYKPPVISRNNPNRQQIAEQSFNKQQKIINHYTRPQVLKGSKIMKNVGDD